MSIGRRNGTGTSERGAGRKEGQVTGRPPICPLNGAPFRNKLSKIKVRPRRGPVMIFLVLSPKCRRWLYLHLGERPSWGRPCPPPSSGPTCCSRLQDPLFCYLPLLTSSSGKAPNCVLPQLWSSELVLRACPPSLWEQSRIQPTLCLVPAGCMLSSCIETSSNKTIFLLITLVKYAIAFHIFMPTSITNIC